MPNGKTHFIAGAVVGATVNAIVQSTEIAMDYDRQFDWGEFFLCTGAGAFAGLAPDIAIADKRRRAYFGPKGWLDADVINRSDLATPRAGPCIVEEYDATCLVPPGWSARLDEYGNIVISR